MSEVAPTLQKLYAQVTRLPRGEFGDEYTLAAAAAYRSVEQLLTDLLEQPEQWLGTAAEVCGHLHGRLMVMPREELGQRYRLAFDAAYRRAEELVIDELLRACGHEDMLQRRLEARCAY